MTFEINHSKSFNSTRKQVILIYIYIYIYKCNYLYDIKTTTKIITEIKTTTKIKLVLKR